MNSEQEPNQSKLAGYYIDDHGTLRRRFPKISKKVKSKQKRKLKRETFKKFEKSLDWFESIWYKNVIEHVRRSWHKLTENERIRQEEIKSDIFWEKIGIAFDSLKKENV